MSPLKKIRVVILPLASVVIAVTGLFASHAASKHPTPDHEKARRVRPLRERFREEFEKAAVAVGTDEADAADRGGRGEGLKNESIGERDAFEAWFVQQRAYPANSIPADAIGRGFVLAQTRNDDSDEHDGDVGSWRPIGPSTIPDGQTDTSKGGPASPVSGRVSAIAVDPRDPDTVYVGGAQGGLWKTENASSLHPVWRPLTDHQASLSVGAIAIDPVQPDIIYVGTGEANRSCDSYYGRGILRSTNGGRTWTLLGGAGAPFNNPGPFAGKAIARIIIDPTTAGSSRKTTLWASTTFGFFASGTIATCATPTPVGVPFGLWRSKDSGATWELQNVPTGAAGTISVQDMALDPTNHDVLYAAVRSTGVFKSVNASSGSPAAFTQQTAGFPTGSSSTPLRRITWGSADRARPGRCTPASRTERAPRSSACSRRPPAAPPGRTSTKASTVRAS